MIGYVDHGRACRASGIAAHNRPAFAHYLSSSGQHVGDFVHARKGNLQRSREADDPGVGIPQPKRATADLAHGGHRRGDGIHDGQARPLCTAQRGAAQLHRPDAGQQLQGRAGLDGHAIDQGHGRAGYGIDQRVAPVAFHQPDVYIFSGGYPTACSQEAVGWVVALRLAGAHHLFVGPLAKDRRGRGVPQALQNLLFGELHHPAGVGAVGAGRGGELQPGLEHVVRQLVVIWDGVVRVIADVVLLHHFLELGNHHFHREVFLGIVRAIQRSPDDLKEVDHFRLPPIGL